ncbi:MAG: NAD(P)H-dependent oxidoreductase [Gemmatimonadetes bacterium]|jgi:NAD(P)H-dependent FMN reductase|nr:NAD(P)H-dependent oxidoreductase [Gemmatimonadota bacterium]MBT6144449.1 NAD(P)H-dependent oxidoreductase [Gemmatimonadota bacterium]MBT7863965.1 NAD(P)H-dependent oxidoreductase [Gemmatimonadota bacterium]
MPKIVVISGSLHPMSRSRVLARHTVDTLASMQVEADFVDLRDVPMELCDGAGGGKTEAVLALGARIAAAGAVIVSVPIYVYDVNAAIKNLVELTGRSWTDKPVGLLCAAGGRSSYMSVMAFANSLMLDFRCLIVPRFVYATGDDFGDDRTESMHIASDELRDRLDDLARSIVHLCRP